MALLAGLVYGMVCSSQARPDAGQFAVAARGVAAAYAVATAVGNRDAATDGSQTDGPISPPPPGVAASMGIPDAGEDG